MTQQQRQVDKVADWHCMLDPEVVHHEALAIIDDIPPLLLHVVIAAAPPPTFPPIVFLVTMMIVTTIVLQGWKRRHHGPYWRRLGCWIHRGATLRRSSSLTLQLCCEGSRSAVRSLTWLGAYTELRAQEVPAGGAMNNILEWVFV
jgi:hypothetical protein